MPTPPPPPAPEWRSRRRRGQVCGAERESNITIEVMDDIVDRLRREKTFEHGYGFQESKICVDAANEIEKLRTMLYATQYDALGFAYAWACSLLERGLDPRKVEVSELALQWEGMRKTDSK